MSGDQAFPDLRLLSYDANKSYSIIGDISENKTCSFRRRKLIDTGGSTSLAVEVLCDIIHFESKAIIKSMR